MKMTDRTAATPIDYDGSMQANLTRVFGERDAGRRLLAIRALYAEDAVLNEPHAAVRGHVAINDAVSAVLAHLPPTASFQAVGKAQGHHSIGLLRWRSVSTDQAVIVTGTDVMHFQPDGLIHSAFVFLDTPSR
jgi:hypothetical protein